MLAVIAIVGALSCRKPPQVPDRPWGASQGIATLPVACTTQTINPSGSMVAYQFDWGGVQGNWSHLMEHGSLYGQSYSFAEPDIHEVRARARNEEGLVSEWSEPFPIDIATYVWTVLLSGTRDSVLTAQTDTFSLQSAEPGGRTACFVVDWDDGTSDTTGPYPVLDTAWVHHAWTAPGTRSVAACAFLLEDSGTVSGWSKAFEVKVTSSAPGAMMLPDSLLQVRPDTPVVFRAVATDPDLDSVAVRFSFGDGDTGDWGTWVGSGETASDTHTYPANAPDTLYICCRARDIHGVESEWSEPLQIQYMGPGRMRWWWVTPNKDSAGPVTAPVVAPDYSEMDELVYVGCNDEHMEIYGIDVSTGREKKSGKGILPEEGYEWTTHPAYNWATGHTFIAKDDGELYAFKDDLSTRWHWPGMTNEGDLRSWKWGNMCLAGNNIYIPNLDTIIRGRDTIRNVTKFYWITDGLNPPVNPYFYVLGVQEVLGAPVLDNLNNVYFVTDSGLMWKLSRELHFRWRVPVTAEPKRLYGPVLGLDGTAFCGDEDGKVYAYSSDSSLRWTTRMTGVTEMYLVVGNQYLFAACDNGHVYALDPAYGTIVWDKVVSSDAGISAHPVLASNGYMFVVDENTKLSCLVHATGEKVWDIACADHYPGGSRVLRAGRITPTPSPTLTSDGDIIVVGDDALYCVCGYKDGTLDYDAPWPKWQRDVYNTGRWPGF